MILAAAIVLAALAALLSSGIANRLNPFGLNDPHSESSQADALIEHATGDESPPGVVALLSLGRPGHPRKGSTAALMEGLSKGFKIHQLKEAIESDHAVGEVVSALDVGPRFISRDKSLTYMTVRLRKGPERVRVDEARHLANMLRHRPGVKLGGLELGAAQGTDIVEQELKRSELIAFPIFLVLLVWFFRGLIAALLPLIIAGLAIVFTRAGLLIAVHALPISAFALGFTTAVGLGLAIDYSLLMVSRFREELALNPNVPDALRRTMATAGRTVLFSACTAVVALGSLLVLPQPYFYSLGLGGALTAALVCLSALTVLPALLALLGSRVNSLSPSWLQRSAAATARPVLNGRWYRLASAVMRRPVAIAICASVFLLALGAPALGVRFTAPNSSVLPTSTSARQVSDTLGSDFKLNPERTVEVVTVHATKRQLANYRHKLEHLPGIVSTTPFQHLKRHTAAIYLTTAGPVTGEQAQQVVKRIRAMPVAFERKVGGPTAVFVDLEASLSGHLLLIALLVAFTTCLSIFLLTGSVVLPPKTLLMNLLTLCASLGAMVLVFQHGSNAIEVAQPALLLAVVFALSTDYGVFLIDRIREIHDGGAGNEEAIALGLERSGRITTTAALLLCVALGSLLTSRLISARELGFGIVIAILLDATVVRALLVPALMRLLGEANWWAPAPLRALHRRLVSGQPSSRHTPSAHRLQPLHDHAEQAE